MNGLFIRPIMPQKISSAQVQENIRAIFKEAESLKSFSGFSGKNPTYRTVRQFSIDDVFFFFGLKRSALFRLTESEYSHFLPKLIVIHCNAQAANNDDEPVIIDDKLFISHNYFKIWISSSNNEVYETEMLKLIMQKIDFKSALTH